MGLLRRSNEALTTNPTQHAFLTTADIQLTTHGSNWLWAATALFALTTLCIFGFSFVVPRRARAMHYIAAAITLVASIDYFTMASNLGWVAIFVEFTRDKSHVSGDTRQIFYVRYIDWFISIGLITTAVLLTCRAPVPLLLYSLFLGWISVATLLTGALVASSYKWGYFVFSILSLFALIYNFVWTGRRYASRLGGSVSRTYIALASWLAFLWPIYFISFGVSEGGNVIGVVGEMVFYGVLDVITKLGFVAILLWGHRQIDPAVLGIAMRDEDEVVVEKVAPRQTAGVTHGTTAEGGVVEGSPVQV